MSTLRKLPFIAAATLAVASSAFAADTIFSQDFTSGGTADLHGTTSTIGGYTWSADTVFKQNGSASATSSTTDRGAGINLGTGFFAGQYALGHDSLILTVTLASSTNAVSFAGFTTDTWIAAASSAVASEFNASGSGNSHAQTQGLTYAARFDSITGTGRDPLSLYRDLAAGDGSNEERLATGDTLPFVFPEVLTLTINAGATGYDNATLVLTGGTNTVQYAGVNLTNFNTLFLGFEANGTSSHGLTGVSLTAVPEPSTYGLLGAGAFAAIAFVRRRRKSA